ncbi:hypothetical protein [Actinacidiphila glaucinigra]
MPTYPDELRVIEAHLLRLLARIREQRDAATPLHPDLPADRAWLRIIEAHTAGQLRRAGDRGLGRHSRHSSTFGRAAWPDASAGARSSPLSIQQSWRCRI